MMGNEKRSMVVLLTFQVSVNNGSFLLSTIKALSSVA